MGLSQTEAARRLKLSENGLWDLEQEKRQSVSYVTWPQVIAFLGFDPWDPGPEASLGDRLRAARRRRGLNREALADFLGIAVQSVWRMERGMGVSKRNEEALRAFVGE